MTTSRSILALLILTSGCGGEIAHPVLDLAPRADSGTGSEPADGHDSSALDARDAGTVAQADLARTSASPDLLVAPDLDPAVTVPDLLVVSTGPDLMPWPSDCGAPGQYCCPGSACSPGNTCVSWGGPNDSYCAPCGQGGQTCCGGNSCAAGFTCGTVAYGGVQLAICTTPTYAVPGGGCGSSADCMYGSMCKGESSPYRCIFTNGPGQPWDSNCGFNVGPAPTALGLDVCTVYCGHSGETCCGNGCLTSLFCGTSPTGDPICP
jgi:hypothetical protein